MKGEFYSQPYLPIIVFSEQELDPKSQLLEWWDPVCFPVKQNREGKPIWGSSEKHREYQESLLVNRREIGAYIPKEDILVIDREVLLHYIIAGCKVSESLRRLLKRLLPDMPLNKGLEFKSLVSLEDWKLHDSAPLIEKHEQVLAPFKKKPKKKRNK